MSSTPSYRHAVSNLRLWLSAFVPALAWALHLAVSYGLVELYCYQFTRMGDAVAVWVLSAVTLLTLVAAFAGTLFCYWNRRIILNRAGAHRGLFIATSGAVLGVFMIATILMQTLPVIMVPPCI